MICPCGSKKNFSECCQPIFDDQKNADSPESLMRSRYCAFVMQDLSHVINTWHPTTRPQPTDIHFDKCKWLGLTIASISRKPDESIGTVTYSARYLYNNCLFIIEECSSFRWENDRWFYYDGDVRSSNTKIAKNGSCPCGSGKKFKRCCMK